MGTRPAARALVAFVSAIGLAVAVLAGTAVVRADSVTIRITDRVTPAAVTVAPGTVVTFVNDDGERHRVRATSGPQEFDSGNLETGERFSVRLDAVGTYTYRDERNTDDANYLGTITVSDVVGATTVPPGPATTAPPPPSAVTVSIGDRVFVPASVVVAPGATVTFVNDDDRPHTVTATDRSFDSGIMAAGARWTHTFRTGGTFDYFCELHPDMVGSVTVQTTGGTPPPATAPPTAPPATAPPPTSPPATTAPPTTPAATAPPTANVSIDGNRFSPGTVTVVVGGTVTWTNAEAVPHTVTARDGSFDSGILRQDGRFSWTFTTLGTFDYLCELHPGMTGTVVVVAAEARVPATTAPPAQASTSTAPSAAPPPTTPPTAGAGVTATVPAGTPLPTTASVSMSGNAYSPRTVTIAVGGTVTWTNGDDVPHTVTASDRSFDSGFMVRGAAWSRTFTAGGTYTYFCEIHPEMTGTIVVTTAGAAPPPAVTPPSAPTASAAPSAPPSAPSSAPATSGGSLGAGATVATGGVAAPGTASVDMGGDRFRPALVTIAAGGVVTWTNTDSVPHTVTASDGSFDSGIMMPGDTFTRRFDPIGTVRYRCTLHPGMTGTVEVVAPGSPVEAGPTADGTESGSPPLVASPAAGPATDPAAGPALADVAGVRVSITDDTFPAVVVISAGQTVTWVNDDRVDHHVTASDGSFASGPMRPGDEFAMTFDRPGAVPYRCDLHRHMRGLVIVLPAEEASATEDPLVGVTDTGFEPAALTVHQGATVRWAFGGVLPHTVTADDGSFDSGVLEPGQTFRHRFDRLGTFQYTCILHPEMTGTVTVVPADEVIPEDQTGLQTVVRSVGDPPAAAPAAAVAPGDDGGRSSPLPFVLVGLLAGIAVTMLIGLFLSSGGRREVTPTTA